jgi:hypothetical protein
VWVVGKEVVRGRIQISEIAAAASGNGYLFANALGMFKHYDFTAAFSCLNRTKETCCSSADYNDICLMHVQSVSP